MAKFNKSVVTIACTLALFTGTYYPSMANSPSGGTAGIDVANMDKAAPPGNDFYQYANGTWLKNTPIPNEYDKWGTLNIIHDKNLVKLKTIMEKASANQSAEAGSNEKKIGDFYFAGMDEKSIEAADLTPLAEEFALIEKMKSVEDLRKEVARLHQRGVNVVFNVSSGQDFKDSDSIIAQTFQGGLGLPDRDYYTNTDERSKKLREQYVKHIARMLVLTGYKESDAQDTASAIMKIETSLAEASMKNTDMRDPDKIYHKLTVDEMNKLTANLSWTEYFKEIGHPNIECANVGQPDFFKTLDGMLTSVSMNDWKNYLRWQVLNQAAPYLSSKFVDADFEFYGKTLTGKKENLPRWKRVISAVDRYMGEASGQLYVKENFPERAKEKALHLVRTLKQVLKEDLEQLDWMDSETKKNALAKLDTLALKIGYPDKFRDYSKLSTDRNSYVASILNGEQFEFHRQMTKIGKPVDRAEWFMSPQTVNAYYSAEMNEIVFPAGILQHPIFDPDADDATNLGAMGMIIGHELTHGFDDQGSKFDGKGNLRNWWSAEDLKRFKERIALIEQQYETYKVDEDVHFKGKLVAGEAAADLGGLSLSYRALEKLLGSEKRVKDKDGFTPEQRFFISFAQAWATNIRPEKARMMAAVDPHPTPHYRVNGTLANMDSFEKVFALGENHEMMLPTDKRCRLW